jgi:hypothetical protein
MTFDAWTLRHLDAWLDSFVNGDTAREKVRERMLAFAADDPEYWSAQGWPNLYDRAKCWDVEKEWR